jgi:phosphoglycolate phosphatase-like HAD superfamily hydrolase
VTTRLVLWDIDQTLVDLSGLGAAWYASALAAVAGKTLREWPRFGGRTERAITMDILIAHDIEATDEAIQRLWNALIEASERALPTLSQGGRALPGAAEALSTMAGLGVVQSLVTGNLPEISRHKLTAFDLHTHVDFEIGGYGSLSAHRPDLVPHAVERATAKHGTPFSPESVVIIGDTPQESHRATFATTDRTQALTGFENASLPLATMHSVATYKADEGCPARRAVPTGRTPA